MKRKTKTSKKATKVTLESLAKEIWSIKREISKLKKGDSPKKSILEALAGSLVMEPRKRFKERKEKIAEKGSDFMKQFMSSDESMFLDITKVNEYLVTKGATTISPDDNLSTILKAVLVNGLNSEEITKDNELYIEIMDNE